MQELAIVYAAIAWLACWFVDLLVMILTSPVFLPGPTVKAIIVLLCLLVILWRLSHHGWLFGA